MVHRLQVPRVLSGSTGLCGCRFLVDAPSVSSDEVIWKDLRWFQNVCLDVYSYQRTMKLVFSFLSVCFKIWSALFFLPYTLNSMTFLSFIASFPQCRHSVSICAGVCRSSGSLLISGFFESPRLVRVDDFFAIEVRHFGSLEVSLECFRIAIFVFLWRWLHVSIFGITTLAFCNVAVLRLIVAADICLLVSDGALLFAYASVPVVKKCVRCIVNRY